MEICSNSQVEIESETSETVVSKYEIIKAILIAITGFLLGGAEIFNVIAPFGVAIVSTIPLIYLLPCIIGAILSTMLFINSTQVNLIILAILFAGGLRVILEKIATKFSFCTTKPILYALISLSSMTVGVFGHALINFSGGISVILLCMQVVLAGCFAYFFAIAIDALLNHKISKTLSHIQLTSIGILTIILICGASSFHFSSLNIGVILSVILIYVITNRFNLFGASMISIIVSIALNLYSPHMLGFTAMLIISSFFSGIFSVQGKFFQIASFLVITSFCYLFLSSIIDLTSRVIDIFFATTIYILLPSKLFAFLDYDLVEIEDSAIIEVEPSESSETEIMIETIDAISSFEVQQDVCEKLLFASDTMQDLKDNLTTISKKFLNIEYNNITSIPEAVSNSVCKSCSRNISCWGKNYSDTIDNFNPIITKLKASGNIDEVSVPDYFLSKCCKLTRFIEAVNDTYNAFLIRQNVKRQVCESRAMVFEQFSSISNLLCEISKDLENVIGYDETIARIARKAYCELEEEPIKISCIIDKQERKTLEIYTDKILQSDPDILCKVISLSTKLNFDSPDITIANAKTKISLSEKPKFMLDFATKQICGTEPTGFKDNELSGDTVETFINSKGQAFFLLSDGMGKGTRAAIDSVMTCSIMSKLLKAGFGIESSIKLINSSLVVKSTDESLATIDLAKIDLYSGGIELVKAGATESFIYSKEQVTRVTTQSLPIGILQKPEFDSYASTVTSGDILLIVSDGVTNSEVDTQEEWVADSLKKLALESVDAETISNTIAEKAKVKSSTHQDDITVVTVRFF